VNYQLKLRKSVVIVYDPLRSTAQGTFCLKAYRLSDSFVELYQQENFSIDSFAKTLTRASYADIFEEIPIIVRNSRLVNASLYELEDSRLLQTTSERNQAALNRFDYLNPNREVGGGPSFEVLDLSMNSFLEKNLESLLDSLEELSNEQNKFQFYQRAVYKHQLQLNANQQKKRENAARREAGEEELPEEEQQQIYKVPQEPSQLKSVLKSNQINDYCHQINHFAGQNFTKLFLLNGLNKE